MWRISVSCQPNGSSWKCRALLHGEVAVHLGLGFGQAPVDLRLGLGRDLAEFRPVACVLRRLIPLVVETAQVPLDNRLVERLCGLPVVVGGA